MSSIPTTWHDNSFMSFMSFIHSFHDAAFKIRCDILFDRPTDRQRQTDRPTGEVGGPKWYPYLFPCFRDQNGSINLVGPYLIPAKPSNIWLKKVRGTWLNWNHFACLSCSARLPAFLFYYCFYFANRLASLPGQWSPTYLAWLLKLGAAG